MKKQKSKNIFQLFLSSMVHNFRSYKRNWERCHSVVCLSLPSEISEYDLAILLRYIELLRRRKQVKIFGLESMKIVEDTENSSYRRKIQLQKLNPRR